MGFFIESVNIVLIMSLLVSSLATAENGAGKLLCLTKLYQSVTPLLDITQAGGNYVWALSVENEIGDDSIANTAYFDDASLGRSEFKAVSWTDNNGDHSALVYLYHNKESANEHSAFVNFEGYSYHFSGDVFVVPPAGGGNWFDTDGKSWWPAISQCTYGEYEWNYHHESTVVEPSGYFQYSISTNF
ncbi:hypothetical protein V1525DRAFT_184705 [Lipomyces kononenkoae]|uniref:Uncharacterized protein n=1 Tax=Lipomyces kononenkoae TaxID=34357 RepID=A0ACC3SZF7_LIPKO